MFYPALLFHVGKSIEVRAFVERFREIKRNFPLRPHHRKFRLILSDLSLSVTTTETDISLASFNMSERERMINDSIFFQPLLARFLFLFYFDCYCLCNASQSHLKSCWKKSCLHFRCSTVARRSREPYMVLPAQLPT